MITCCYTCPLEIASISINLASNAHTLHDSNLTSVLGGRFVGYLKQLLSLQDCLCGKCNHFWLTSFRQFSCILQLFGLICLCWLLSASTCFYLVLVVSFKIALATFPLTCSHTSGPHSGPKFCPKVAPARRLSHTHSWLWLICFLHRICCRYASMILPDLLSRYMYLQQNTFCV